MIIDYETVFVIQAHTTTTRMSLETLRSTGEAVYRALAQETAQREGNQTWGGREDIEAISITHDLSRAITVHCEECFYHLDRIQKCASHIMTNEGDPESNNAVYWENIVESIEDVQNTKFLPRDTDGWEKICSGNFAFIYVSDATATWGRAYQNAVSDFNHKTRQLLRLSF